MIAKLYSFDRHLQDIDPKDSLHPRKADGSKNFNWDTIGSKHPRLLLQGASWTAILPFA